VSDPQRTFVADVANISGGGLCGSAPMDAARTTQPGDLFWTEFDLPDERGSYEFVVRIAHVQRADSRGTLVLGCVFCPGEHPLTYRVQLHQIAQFVALRRRAAPAHAGY